ncbi:hypothetical protein F7725_016376, partial [Dissostichus mawsoni]
MAVAAAEGGCCCWRVLLLEEGAAGGGGCCWRVLKEGAAAEGGCCCWRRVLLLEEGAAGGGINMFAVGLQFLFLLTCGVTLGQAHVSIGRDAERDYFEWRKVGPGGETLDVFKYDAGLHYKNNGLPGQSEQFKGRVSHFLYKLKYGNASIVIGNTTAADRGNYTCSFPRVQPPLNFYLELVVGEQENEDSRGAMLMVGIFPIVSLAVILAAVVALLFLFLLTCGVTLGQEHDAVRVVVPEGRDAVLPLSIGRNAEDFSLTGGESVLEEKLCRRFSSICRLPLQQREQFKGRVSHFPAELKHGNASIVIRKTTAADRGNYTCYFPRLQPPQTFYFELDVAATPKPRVMILTATADRALLQCEVPGASLNTKAEWQSRDGNRLEAEEERVPEKDHVFISLSVNVSRTDLYLCVVSQEDIKHRVSAEISVHVCEKESEDCYSTGAMVIVGISSFVLGAAILAAVLALLVRGKCIIILNNKGSALKGREESDMGNAVIKVIATEGKDVILPCSPSTREDLQDKLLTGRRSVRERHSARSLHVRVQFKGRVSHFQNELKHGNASIVIKKTKVIDSGSYTCVFHVYSLVKNSSLSSLFDRALLHCEVPGASLNTKAEWQSRDGNRLDAEEERVPEKHHVFISLSVNVSRTDLYLCVVSQEDIKHRKEKKIESEDSYSPWPIVIVGIVSFVSGALILAAVQALLVRGKCIKILHNKDSNKADMSRVLN